MRGYATSPWTHTGCFGIEFLIKFLNSLAFRGILSIVYSVFLATSSNCGRHVLHSSCSWDSSCLVFQGLDSFLYFRWAHSVTRPLLVHQPFPYLYVYTFFFLLFHSSLGQRSVGEGRAGGMVRCDGVGVPGRARTPSPWPGSRRRRSTPS